MIKLGSLKIDPIQYGSQGNAILGIRDSGKTYTATFMAEQLFDAGIPFVVFDPIGVWRFLRVPGQRQGGRGYPVVVAGGQEGDLPLTVAGAPEIVRAAMHNGVSLVIDLFDMKLSKADWRRIVMACVRVLLHENQRHGLRHVFIEEAAEFVPQKVLDGAVYAEIEKLARMGGNARLGYTLINQRSQEVAKAVLELCENMFLHRQRGKNALDSLDKWLAIAGAAEQREIISSLPSLPQGACWVWLGGDEPRPPALVHIPPKHSLHPDRRVMRGDTIVKAKNAVDVGKFVDGMKAALPALEQTMKDNDVPTLRKRITELEAAAKKPAAATPAIDKAALEAAEALAFEKGVKAARREAEKQAQEQIRSALDSVDQLVAQLSGIVKERLKAVTAEKVKLGAIEFTPAPRPATQRSIPAAAPRRSAPVPNPTNGEVPALKAERKPLGALVAVYPAGMTEAQWAVAAGLKRKGGTWGTYLSRLRTAGCIEKQGEEFFATELGVAAAGDSVQVLPPPGPELVAFWKGKISGVGPMLDALAAHYPNAMTREDLATVINLAAGGGTFGTYVSRLRSPGLIEVDGQNLRCSPSLMGAA